MKTYRHSFRIRGVDVPFHTRDPILFLLVMGIGIATLVTHPPVAIWPAIVYGIFFLLVVGWTVDKLHTRVQPQLAVANRRHLQEVQE